MQPHTIRHYMRPNIQSLAVWVWLQGQMSSLLNTQSLAGWILSWRFADELSAEPAEEDVLAVNVNDLQSAGRLHTP